MLSSLWIKQEIILTLQRKLHKMKHFRIKSSLSCGRNLCMDDLHKEEMFTGGSWWKEHYGAKAVTDKQAVVVRSVMLLHHESMQGHVVSTAKSLTAGRSTEHGFSLQSWVLIDM